MLKETLRLGARFIFDSDDSITDITISHVSVNGVVLFKAKTRGNERGSQYRATLSDIVHLIREGFWVPA